MQYRRLPRTVFQHFEAKGARPIVLHRRASNDVFPKQPMLVTVLLHRPSTRHPITSFSVFVHLPLPSFHPFHLLPAPVWRVLDRNPPRPSFLLVSCRMCDRWWCAFGWRAAPSARHDPNNTDQTYLMLILGALVVAVFTGLFHGTCLDQTTLDAMAPCARHRRPCLSVCGNPHEVLQGSGAT